MIAMPRISQPSQHESEIVMRTGEVFAVITLCLSVTLVFKAPEYWPMLILEFSKLLQYIGVSTHWQSVIATRCMAELLQNGTVQTIARGEWTFSGFAPRQLPFEIRVRTILMLASCDVSVIVPSLNEGEYLPRCLKSLVRQSGRRMAEIIVVDGGSTDDTIQVAEEYADKVLIEPARPVGAARNIGARQAQGEILAFIDADTMASEHWVEEIALSLDSKLWAVGVTGPTLPYEGTQFDRLVHHVATGWVQRFSLRLGRPHVAGFNCAYRKRPFWDAGGFDADRVLLEDVMLSLRMRHHGRIVFNPDMVAYTSLRRIRRYGYPYLMTYNAINWIVTLLSNQTLTYPQIR